MRNNLVAMYLLVKVSIYYIRHSCLLLCLYCFIFFLAVVEKNSSVDIYLVIRGLPFFELVAFTFNLSCRNAKETLYSVLLYVKKFRYVMAYRESNG